MDHSMYPPGTPELARRRAELAPAPLAAFKAFSAAVFAEGYLPTVTKQLIAWRSRTSPNVPTASRATRARRWNKARPRSN